MPPWLHHLQTALLWTALTLPCALAHAVSFPEAPAKARYGLEIELNRGGFPKIAHLFDLDYFQEKVSNKKTPLPNDFYDDYFKHRPANLDDLPASLREELTQGLHLDTGAGLVQLELVDSRGQALSKAPSLILPGQRMEAPPPPPVPVPKSLEKPPEELQLSTTEKNWREWEIVHERWRKLRLETKKKYVKWNHLSPAKKADVVYENLVYVIPETLKLASKTNANPEFEQNRKLLEKLTWKNEPIGAIEFVYPDDLKVRSAEELYDDIERFGKMAMIRKELLVPQEAATDYASLHYHISLDGQEIPDELAELFQDNALLKRLSRNLPKALEGVFGYGYEIKKSGMVHKYDDDRLEYRDHIESLEDELRFNLKALAMPTEKASSFLRTENSKLFNEHALKLLVKKMDPNYQRRFFQRNRLLDSPGSVELLQRVMPKLESQFQRRLVALAVRLFSPKQLNQFRQFLRSRQDLATLVQGVVFGFSGEYRLWDGTLWEKGSSGHSPEAKNPDDLLILNGEHWVKSEPSASLRTYLRDMNSAEKIRVTQELIQGLPPRKEFSLPELTVLEEVVSDLPVAERKEIVSILDRSLSTNATPSQLHRVLFKALRVMDRELVSDAPFYFSEAWFDPDPDPDPTDLDLQKARALAQTLDAGNHDGLFQKFQVSQMSKADIERWAKQVGWYRNYFLTPHEKLEFGQKLQDSLKTELRSKRFSSKSSFVEGMSAIFTETKISPNEPKLAQTLMALTFDDGHQSPLFDSWLAWSIRPAEGKDRVETERKLLNLLTHPDPHVRERTLKWASENWLHPDSQGYLRKILRRFVGAGYAGPRFMKDPPRWAHASQFAFNVGKEFNAFVGKEIRRGGACGRLFGNGATGSLR